MLATSARPASVFQSKAGIDSPVTPCAESASTDATFVALNCRLFSALLVSLNKRASSSEHGVATRARTLCHLGCGRQEFRVLDVEHRRENQVKPALLQIEMLLAQLCGPPVQ